MRGTLAIALLAACGSSSSPGPDAPPPTNTGLVTVGQFHGSGISTTAATAQFVMGDIFGTQLGRSAECTLTMNPPGAGLSAGSIAISGTTTPVTLTPSGNPAMYTASGLPASNAFTAGAMITATAPGADIPAFTVSATAPASVDGFTRPTTISRAAGFHAMWTAGATSGKMWLLLEAASGGGPTYVMVCRIADSGSYLVTPAQLALFPAGVTSVVIVFARIGESDSRVGDTGIDFVVMDAAGPDGATSLTP